jgi:hypothetical protein
MKCDVVLERSETGNWFERWQARRHAARCDACASALRSFEEAKQRWAKTEPLSPRHQVIWNAASRQPAMASRTRSKASLAIAAVTLAASLLLILFAWPWQKTKEQNVREVRSLVQIQQTPTSVVPLSEDFIAKEFAPLEEKLRDLEREIDQLRASAEKRDAQFQLAQLTKEYPKKEANTP